MAKFTIQTKRGLGYISWRMKILIDDKEVETMNRKQTREIELTNESHRLQIAGGWHVKTGEISFDAGNPKIFQVSVNPLINWARIYLLIVVIVTILKDTTVGTTQLLPIKTGTIQMWMLALPAFFVILYFVTIGRKYFFIVKELRKLNPSLY